VRDPAHPNRRTVANTAPLVHNGKLFALKEDGLPHRIDPNTLETLGTWDFNGGWKSQTFTAHPKLDPVSGDMIAYGNEAEGLASDALWIYRIGGDGTVRQEVRTRVPYVSVMHDMAITQKHLIFPFAGYVTSAERLANGQVHWGWDKTKPSCIGVLPRDGDARDMRWFEGPLRCMMHTFNAHDEGDKVVLYAPFYDGQLLSVLSPMSMAPGSRPELARSFRAQDHARHVFTKWRMDPRRSSGRPSISDLGKVDPRVLSLETRYPLYLVHRSDRPFDRNRAPGLSRPPVKQLRRFDLQTGEVESTSLDRPMACRKSRSPAQGRRRGQRLPDGRGKQLCEQRSELVIMDAERLRDGDIARVILPFKLSSQVHGVWAAADELPLA
jgi:carotenoid cleavage dioxygenase